MTEDRPNGYFSSDPEIDQIYRMMERVTDILGRMTGTVMLLTVIVVGLILVVVL